MFPLIPMTLASLSSDANIYLFAAALFAFGVWNLLTAFDDEDE